MVISVWPAHSLMTMLKLDGSGCSFVTILITNPKRTGAVAASERFFLSNQSRRERLLLRNVSSCPTKADGSGCCFVTFLQRPSLTARLDDPREARVEKQQPLPSA